MGGRGTLEERSLVYLLDRADVPADSPAAQELVQDRIAANLAVRRAHVSRAMGRLRGKGFVRTAKVHVRGEARRRIAYFLTDDGLRRAKEVRRRLEEGRVIVIDAEGRESERRLYQVPLLLPRRPRFSDLLASVEDEYLDLRRVLDRQARLRRGVVYDVEGAAAPRHFQGRARELARLDAFLADPRIRGLILIGLPGIGKTALAGHWVAGLQGRVHVAWRRLRPETTAWDVLHEFAGILRALGRPALANHFRQPTDGGVDRSVRILHRDLAGIRALFVVDDVHAAPSEVTDLLGGLLRIEPDRTGLKLLVLSRERLPFCRVEDFAQGRLWEMELRDLPRADAEAILGALGVDRTRRSAIWERVGGHPFSLELAAAGGMPLERVRAASTSRLARELLPGLGPAARDTLGLAAVFDGPLPLTFLGPHARELLELCLLREAGEDSVELHDLVREAVAEEVEPDRLAALHRRAGELLADSRRPRDALDALRHFVRAAATREAGWLAVERGDEVINAGFAEALNRVLERLVWDARGTSLEPRVRLLQGHALFALGRWADAVSAYERAAKTEDPTTAAEALLGQGKAEAQRRSRLSLQLLVKARDQLERLGSLRLLAEALYWIGGVHEDAGRLDDALDAFEKGRAVAFDIGDRRWEGLCAYGIGRLRSLRGDYAGAVDEEREALRLLERAGHRLDIAKVCAGLGGNLLELHRYEEAERYLSRAAAEAQATGATAILASSLYNLASLNLEAGQLEGSAALFEEALRTFEENEQRDRAAWCAAWLAYLAWARGEGDLAARHMHRAAGFVSRTAEPALRVRALRHMAEAAVRAGQPGRAREVLAQALAESRMAQLVRQESEIEAALKELA